MDSIRLPTNERAGLVVPAGDPLAGRELIGLEDLPGLPLIVPESYRETGLLGDERPTSEGGRLDFVTTFGLTFNATRLVAAGMGYAVCLAGLADLSADSGLAFVPLDVRLDMPSYLVWKSFQLRTRACEAFLERMREAYDA